MTTEIQQSAGATVTPLHPELKLTAGQQRAFDLINQAATDGRSKIPFAVVSGYAGTGKTTLLRLAKPLRPLLIAPTGKAALRLQEATGQRASTIHRAFKTAVENPNDPDGDPIFLDKSAEIPDGCKVILLDEASMVGEELWNDVLMHARRLDLPVVAVGDPFQIPPVAPESETPFSVLKLGTPHRAELTEVLRQAQDNPIIAASMRIREGDARTALKVFERVPVGQLGAADSHLYLWATDQHTELAFRCLRAWDFRFIQFITWVKVDADDDERLGGGHYYRHAAEQCLFAVRGRAPVRRHDEPASFRAPRGRHSGKPDVFFDKVERMSFGPRVELFARVARIGWAAWGDQMRGRVA